MEDFNVPASKAMVYTPGFLVAPDSMLEITAKLIPERWQGPVVTIPHAIVRAEPSVPNHA